MSGRVVVVGSINMDVVMTAARLPVRGETLLGEGVAFHPGGKGANQAVAAARLGARCSLIGAVGDDPFGEELRAFLAGSGVDVGGVRPRAGVATGVASIVVADGDNAIVVAPGANAALTPEDLLDVSVSPGDVVVAQLEIPTQVAEAAFMRARDAGATAILNAAPVRPCPRALLEAADVLVVNELELAALGGVATDPERAARAVRTRPAQTVVVTLGARGAVAVVGERTLHLPAPTVEAVDTTGAGDCFVGALAAATAAERSLGDALATAVAAASISVQRPGAGPSMPTPQEVAAAMANPSSLSGVDGTENV